MLLAQGRFWRASLSKDSGSIELEILRAALPENLQDLRDFAIDVPLAKWNLVVKNAHSDRKLLGGLLLDFAKIKDRVSTAVGNDRLLGELRRIVVEATVVLVEEGVAVIAAPDASEA